MASELQMFLKLHYKKWYEICLRKLAVHEIHERETDVCLCVYFIKTVNKVKSFPREVWSIRLEPDLEFVLQYLQDLSPEAYIANRPI